MEKKKDVGEDVKKLNLLKSKKNLEVNANKFKKKIK